MSEKRVAKEDDSLTSVCSVCSSPAAPHLHYGAVSCYSCRAFFRRGQPKQVRWVTEHSTDILHSLSSFLGVFLGMASVK